MDGVGGEGRSSMERSYKGIACSEDIALFIHKSIGILLYGLFPIMNNYLGIPS